MSIHVCGYVILCSLYAIPYFAVVESCNKGEYCPPSAIIVTVCSCFVNQVKGTFLNKV